MNKAPKPVANIAPFGLRMQPALREKVQSAADENAHSMNQEIVNRLERSFAPAALDDITTSSLLGAISRQDLLLKSNEAHMEFVLNLALGLSSKVVNHAMTLASTGKTLEEPLADALKLIKLFLEAGYVQSDASNKAQNILEATVAEITGRPMPEPLESHDHSLLADDIATKLNKLGFTPQRIGIDPHTLIKAADKIKHLQKNL